VISVNQAQMIRLSRSARHRENCIGFFLAEKRKHLPVEGGQVRRLPTADPVAVPDHFTVYPLAAGIANVILDGVIAG
jgi:hypothetical protein